MITKKELLEKIKGIEASGLRYFPVQDLLEWAESLPDDEPTTIPFRLPVPDGYEVVTRDGRKVEQLIFFDAIGHCIAGVVEGELEDWDIAGNYFDPPSEGKNDLFLRPIEKKAWVVEGKDHVGVFFQVLCSSLKDAKNWAGPDTIIYEATLKPVK